MKEWKIKVEGGGVRRERRIDEEQIMEEEGGEGDQLAASPQQCFLSVFCLATKRITDTVNQKKLRGGRRGEKERERGMKEGESENDKTS